jgi:glycosyltransferase involved in cell wall biosynthesis
MSIARYLDRERFALTVCALRSGGWDESQPLLQKMGVPAFVLPFRPTGRSVGHYWQSLVRQREIAVRGPFDIQHSMDFTSSPFEGIMARLAGRPYIYSQRNLNENGHRSLLRLKFKSADAIIGISDAVTAFLRSEGVANHRMETIYLGLDLDCEELSFRPVHRGNYILVVGQFERRKRHDDAIRAFAAISNDYPGLELWLAGNTFDLPYEAGLHRLAADLKVSHRVKFLGPRRDAIDLMRTARSVLLCSEREAFGWVLLEALAAGVPLIASASEGPSQVVQNERTGLLVPPCHVDGYAAALRRVLGDEALTQSLVAAARLHVERNYSARVMVKLIEELYTRVNGQCKKN